MCWSIRVLWTVMQNLFIRVTHDAIENYNCCTCCSHHNSPSRRQSNNTNCQNIEEISELNNKNNDHDYIVISSSINTDNFVDDLSPPLRKFKTIESEQYFRAIDRFMAEDILSYRDDGSCLVRPYREEDISIKYVVSITARNHFFHLYVRKIYGQEKYGIGLEKPYEKLFNTPNDIVSYYQINKLLCTNKSISISVLLIPIT